MPLWKLTPLDLLDPNWEASSHRGIAIVRARSEADARAVAAKAFDTQTRFTPGAGPRIPPWKRAAMVRAQRIDDKRYEPEGPSAVLEPSF
jgi:hypothetical protein